MFLICLKLINIENKYMKNKVIYICRECGNKSAKWMGKCNVCGAWDSFFEETVQDSRKLKLERAYDSKILTLDEIPTEENYRIMSGIDEFDRVLGGGIMPGSLILIGGDPGIGKSTLMLQACGSLARFNPLYVTGEESLQQIKYRAGRMKGIPGSLQMMTETNIEAINSAIMASSSDIIVLDSIQSVYSDRIDAAPGSIIQVRESASLMMQTAKKTGKAIFIIGHVTKEGIIAGPKILEHMVDTVLQFEGEKTYSYRILRSLKNRFGSTNEIGIFEMSEFGLAEVKNPSEVFLAHRMQQDSGIAIVTAIEGTRPILLEVQALVSFSGYGMPQRTSTGYDGRRLQMILAVLEKRLGLQFRQSDVFVNLAGGVYLNDTSIDLGVAAALASSYRESPISSKFVLIGEIGLTGEVRPVSAIEQRILEAEKLGFECVVLPKTSYEKLVRNFSIKLIPVEKISLALAELL